MSHPLLPAIDRRTGIVQGITFATDGTGEDVTIRRQAEKNWTDFCKYLESCSSWWGSFINGARGSKSAASDSTCETVAGLREDPPGAGILSSFIDNSHANARVEQAEMTEFALSGGGMASAVSALDFRQAGSQREINPPVSLSGSNEWQANVEGSELIISPPSWKSKLVGPSQATYHVTRLTTLAAGTLTVSLSKMLADILLLPLEALFIRSVALAYLDTADGASYAAMGLRQEIYPLGSWFGTALRGGRAMDYVRKMTLCFGLDMLLGFGAWQVTAGAAWWVGQKFCRWGQM
ncbi:MAG: hypothetical protein L6R40_001939 [Gallowayella cf. fulva]|nr:MAG: hypothetical protein L6R40_001939 [Xanthomendoza cf. fulva]